VKHLDPDRDTPLDFVWQSFKLPESGWFELN